MGISQALLLFCPLLNLTWAQQSPLDDAKTMLLYVRQTVMKTVNSLPKYLCTETVERETFQPNAMVKGHACDEVAKWRMNGDLKTHKEKSDRLRLDVAISGDSEMYSWAGDGHFDDRHLEDLVGHGATSTGTFVSMISELFGTNAAIFTYNGDIVVDGRRLVEYGFHVPIEKSRHNVGNMFHRVVVGYDGTFWADPRTFNLVRLNVSAKDLPRELNACESSSTLDYNTLRINGAEFLIPQEVDWRVINANGSLFHNRTVFSGCHEFVGESTLRFDDATQVAPARLEGNVREIPSDLQFALKLTDPIRTKTAAAGDLIRAQLANAISTKRQRRLAPKGAIVIGRIVRVERAYGQTSQSLTLAVKTETIEINGVTQPFRTKLGAIVKRHERHSKRSAAPERLGSFDQLSDTETLAVAVLRFEHVTDDFVVNAGLEIVGKTGIVH